MPTEQIDTTTITELLDELTEALYYLPGRTPQDAQNAATLLAYVMAGLYGDNRSSRLLMNTLERRGVDADEAREVARALKGLALRLGAWLGRDGR